MEHENGRGRRPAVATGEALTHWASHPFHENTGCIQKHDQPVSQVSQEHGMGPVDLLDPCVL
jgi:hypothetical protein